MKTNQEILDFYGVEIGKKYKITKTGMNPKYYEGLIFVVEETFDTKELYLKIYKHGTGLISTFGINRLNGFDYEEVKEILTEKERAYLSAVIKPFRDKVEFVCKQAGVGSNQEYIRIRLYNDDYCSLPFFKPNQMYKGMEVNKRYTIKELEL